MTNSVRAIVSRAVAPAACAAVLALAPAQSAFAQGAYRDARASRQATVIDDRLESMRVEIVSLDQRALTYVTRHGRRREMPRSQLLAIIPEHAIRLGSTGNTRAELRTGMLMLTDGRRFAGQLSARAPRGDESLIWNHEVFGALEFSLEEIAWLVQPGWTAIDRSPEGDDLVADELLLRNGDRLTGFIAGVDEQFTVEHDDGALSIDVARVGAARFANPPLPPSGTLIWMGDGTVAPLESIDIDEAGSVLMTLVGGQAHTEQWYPVEGILFDAQRLVPISAIAPSREEPAAGRRFALPSRLVYSAAGAAARPLDAMPLHDSAPLDAYDVLIPGPLILEYDLPEGARRLSAVFRLGIGTSPWGDCVAIVSIDGVELFRRRLSTEDPSAPITLDTPGRTLTIEIDPGRFGPINDRVLIERPFVLVQPR